MSDTESLEKMEFVALSLPDPLTQRELQHTRSISFQGYRRSDQLWDVEGYLTDVRPHDASFPGGHRRGGEAIHSMWLRLTVDVTGLIREVHASIDAAPFEGVCGNIESRYRCMVGVRVGNGYRGHVRRLLGGTGGCAHMSELLLSMGTAVIQTLVGEMPMPEDIKPFSLDGCHALDTSGPMVAQFYPRWYRSKTEAHPDESLPGPVQE